MKLRGPELFRIGMTLFMLIGIIALTRPCANAVSNFVMGMDGSNSNAAKAKQMPTPDNVSPVVVPAGTAGSAGDYEHLTPDMTEEQMKTAIERAKAKAAADAAAKGPAAPPAGSATSR
jgi:hypothetical protein